MPRYVALAAVGALAGAAVIAHVLERATRPPPFARLSFRALDAPQRLASGGWTTVAELTEALGDLGHALGIAGKPLTIHFLGPEPEIKP